MPVYEYQAAPGEPGCDYCRKGFTTTQRMKDAPLTRCPRCGSRIIRLVFAPSVSTPHTPAELKNLGFTKLVRRDHGVYENVTRTKNEARYFEADKPHTAPDLKSKISD
jgi:putative FmdB family regulatory protein